MVGADRHQNLVGALPGRSSRIVDLGCGRGETLVALREALGPDARLVGVDLEQPVLTEPLVGDPKVETVVADLNRVLPFADASFDAALCSDTLECLPRKEEFLLEVERVLSPGGHLVLAHTDFDTLVFNSSDIELTRRLVHAFADTQEAWMDSTDGTIGRKLAGIGRRSPFELVEVLAWVAIDTELQQGGRADIAVKGIRGAVRRDGHHDLAAALDTVDKGSAARHGWCARPRACAVPVVRVRILV